MGLQEIAIVVGAVLILGIVVWAANAVRKANRDKV